MNMANKKRRLRMQELHRIKLGRYRLTRRDVLVIEKLLRIYADEFEKRQAKSAGSRITLPVGRKHMPRKYSDRHVVFNDVKADSVKFLPKSIKRSHRFEVRCAPGMWVTFTPFDTTIGGQVLYATGAELKAIYEASERIERFIKTRPGSLINVCLLLS